ncbi:MAG: hypothetical protein JO356_20335 [Acidobacteria bacterium]|nr:hypothetical protein [Acidobacteriota bacterium]
MQRRFISPVLVLGFMLPIGSLAQEANSGQPQVKVNVLNVCSPSGEEQQQISGALERIPKRPAFSQDFEVDRGRSVLDPSANPLATLKEQLPAGSAVADFVRLRRDLTSSDVYSTVQYSFSRDSKQMVETLVFRVRDPKDLLQVSIEDSASSVTAPAAMLNATTPAERIKLERFGKSSVVLARCTGSGEGPAPDQTAYEPLFRSATSVLANYRGFLGARTLVPEEMTRLSRSAASAALGPGKKPKSSNSK